MKYSGAKIRIPNAGKSNKCPSINRRPKKTAKTAVDRVVKKSRAKVDSIATRITLIVDFRKRSLERKILLEYRLLKPKYFSVSIPRSESIKWFDRTWKLAY